MLLVLPFISFAQDQMYSHMEEKSIKRSPEDYNQAANNNRYTYEFTPGRELIRAGNKQLIGIGIGMGGTLIGTTIVANGTVETAYLGSIMVVATVVTGLILNISAWTHIKRAGQLMDNNRVSISGKGLTISLN